VVEWLERNDVEGNKSS